MTLCTWHNVDGFGTPWGATIANLAAGVTDPPRIRLADLDGDGRTDLVRIGPNGDVKPGGTNGASPTTRSAPRP